MSGEESFKITRNEKFHEEFNLLNKRDFSIEPEVKIWSEFKNGNESAFIHIYETYFDKLLTYGLNFLPDRDNVKDCIQDMFIEIRDKRVSIGSTNAIKPFLYKILRRRIIRVHNRHSEVQFTAAHEKFSIELSYEEHLINKQFTENQITELKDAIGKLSYKEREAIFHFYFEGHTFQQIADIMGYRDVKTARTLLYRAISSLKKSMNRNVFMLFF